MDKTDNPLYCVHTHPPSPSLSDVIYECKLILGAIHNVLTQHKRVVVSIELFCSQIVRFRTMEYIRYIQCFLFQTLVKINSMENKSKKKHCVRVYKIIQCRPLGLTIAYTYQSQSRSSFAKVFWSDTIYSKILQYIKQLIYFPPKYKTKIQIITQNGKSLRSFNTQIV